MIFYVYIDGMLYFLQLIYELIKDIFKKNIHMRLTAEEEGPHFEKEVKIL